MAVYGYRCNICGKTEDVVQTIRSYSEKPEVPSCSQHGSMVRYFTPVFGQVDIPPFVSPIDGKVLNGRRDMYEHMKAHGVVHYDEIKPDIERARKENERARIKSLKEDLVESAKQVESGFKPKIERAVVENKSIDVLPEA